MEGLDHSASDAFDVFSGPKVDYRIQNIYTQELLPTAPIDKNSTTISFSAEPNQNFTDLANSYIQVKFKLTMPNGGKIKAKVAPPDPTIMDHGMPSADPPWYGCGTINGPGFSMFKDVEMRISDQLVSSMSGLYYMKAYATTLFHYDFEQRNSMLERMLYFDDGDAGNRNPFEFTGYQQRFEYLEESNPFTISAPIYTSFHCQGKFLIPMCKLDYSFTLLEAPVFLLTNQASQAFAYEILEAKMVMRRVSVLPALQNKVERMLAQGSVCQYPLTHINCRKLIIPASLRTYSYQSLFLGEFLPRAVLIAIGTQAQQSNFMESPFNFKSNNLTDVSITVNNQRFPTQSFQLNYAGTPPEFIKGFTSLYPDLWGNKGSWIDLDKYANKGFCFYYISFNSDSPPESSFASKINGPARIDMTFGVDTNPILNVFIWSYSEECIMIDQSRNVRVPFKL